MNKHLKRSAVATLCCLLITAMLLPALAIATSSASAAAASETTAGTTIQTAATTGTATSTGKDEVVYAKLDTLGAVKGIYVVNIFTNTEAVQVTDKGRYTKITNLTTDAEITENYGTITFDAPPGRFYYQGDLDASTPLPWNIVLTYELDGQAIAPADLAGKSGDLEISIDVTPNAAVESTFADNYLLQISGTFPGDVVGDITAENASIADSGSDKIVSFMMLPGKEGHYVIAAPVVDFAFDGFQIAAVPVSFAIEFEDADTADFTSGIVELQDAIATLETGATSLEEGAAQIGSGIATLAAQNSTLTNGSSLIASGIAEAANGAGALDDSTLAELVPGAAQLASGSTAYIGGIEQGIADALTQAGTYGAQAALAQEAYAAALQNAYAKILGGEAVTADDLAAIDAAAQALVQV
ncbi:MAG: hypothetical protein HGA54_02485, partial [Actinobacteria bacterium]|nr:hypothetical protein [Actinomycetota bacterium]